MGSLDQFSQANKLLSEQLGYHLDAYRADHFRAQLRRLGIRRFTEAVRLTALEATEDVQERHCLLEAHMWQLIVGLPRKPRLRNLQANLARATMAAMDARVMELVEAAG